MESTPKTSRRKRGANRPRIVEQLAKLLLTEAVASGTQTQASPGNGRRSRRNRRRRKKRGAGATPGLPLTFPQVGPTNVSSQPIVVSGMDWLESMYVSPTSPDGDPILDFQIAPWDWKGTHAALMCQGYERFRLRHLVVRLSSRVPSIVGGGFVAGISPDPDFEILSSDRHLSRRRIRALAGSVSSNWWQTVLVSLPPQMLNSDWKFTSPGREKRLSSVGRFVGVIDGPPTGVSSNTTIRVTAEISWTLELSGPVVGSSPETSLKTRWIIPANNFYSVSSGSDDKDCWLCSDGHSPDIDVAVQMWDTIPYHCILYVVGGLSKESFYIPPDTQYTERVFWMRKTKLSSGTRAFVCFKSDGEARAAPDDPGRDPKLGQVYVLPNKKIDAEKEVLIFLLD